MAPLTVGASRVGHDWLGETWDRTIVVTVDSPGLIQAHNTAPPALAPFVPGLTHREGFVSVEVRTHG